MNTFVADWDYLESRGSILLQNVAVLTSEGGYIKTLILARRSRGQHDVGMV